MKVWVMTSAGEYGEYYNVNGVYATQELAIEQIELASYKEITSGIYKHRITGDYVCINSFTVWESDEEQT